MSSILTLNSRHIASEADWTLCTNSLGCLPLAVAPVRLYVVPASKKSKPPSAWLLQHEGLCALLAKNLPAAKVSFAIIHPQTGATLWTQRVYKALEYHVEQPLFHAFEADKSFVAFAFGAEDAATKMSGAIKSIMARSESMAAQGSKGSKIYGSNPIIDKSMIGKPEEFRHVSGIQVTQDGGFAMGNIPQQWEEAILAAGITPEQMRDKRTRRFIFKTLLARGDTLGEPTTKPLAAPNDSAQNKSRPPPPAPPGVPRQQNSRPPPPPTPGTVASAPKVGTRPPPPPAPPSHRREQPPQQPSARTRPQPPPPPRLSAPSSTTVRPPPPVLLSAKAQPVVPFAQSSQSAQQLPPPPPPPQAKPLILQKPTEKSITPAAPANSLLDSIRSFKREDVLKNKVSDLAPAAPVVPASGLAAMLIDAMQQRRTRVDDSSGEEEGSSDDGDDYW